MTYLINLVIPSPGNVVTVSNYIETLVNLGYSKHLAISSLGGISGRSATITNGFVTRK